jgi:multiple sugar transport system permease protein
MRRHGSAFRYASLLPAVIVLAVLTVYPVANLLRMSLSTIEFVQGTDVWTWTPMRNLAMHHPYDAHDDKVMSLRGQSEAVAIEMVLGLRSRSWLRARTRQGLGAHRADPADPRATRSDRRRVEAHVQLRLRHFQSGAGRARRNAGELVGFAIAGAMSVIVVDVWHWVPFVFLILFAAVEGLPVDVLEVARVFDFSRWQLIRRVQIPLLRPAIVVALLFRSILAFKVFDEVYLLTSGGPGTATELVNLHLYKVFFEQNQLGYGALLSLAIIAAIVAFLLVARRGVRVLAA